MSLTKYVAVMGALDTFFLVGGLFVHSTLKPGFCNPPTGAVAAAILPTCLLIGVAITTVLPLLYRSPETLKRLVLWGVVASIAFGGVYIFALQRFGRPIVIPQRGIEDFVTVGSERTPFANQYFANATDTEMLEQRGWSENDLELYWTKASLTRARFFILVGLAGVLTSVNMITAGVAALAVKPSL